MSVRGGEYDVPEPIQFSQQCRLILRGAAQAGLGTEEDNCRYRYNGTCSPVSDPYSFYTKLDPAFFLLIEIAKKKIVGDGIFF